MSSALANLIDSLRNGPKAPVVIKDVVEYIELVDDIYNPRFHRSNTLPVSPPKLESFEIQGPYGLVRVYAANGRQVLIKQQDILEAYALRTGLFNSSSGGVVEVQVGPYRYPVMAPTSSIGSTTNHWTGVFPMSGSFKLDIPAGYEPSGVALQNGIGLDGKKCTCEMFVLMSVGCKCGGK